MLDVYVDADGCPVKEEVYRVAERYGLTVFIVSNRSINTPLDERIKPIVVGKGFDAADDWIVDNLSEGDIAVTADLSLAYRCLDKGGYVLTPKGVEHDEASIKSALATKELLEQLRHMGEMTSGPAPMDRRIRSKFLSGLDELINRIKRG